jgi:hypothetical protein
MPTENAATTTSTGDDAFDCDSDEDDPDEASHSFPSSPSDNSSRHEPIESNRSSSWILDSRLIREFFHFLLSEEILKTNLRWQGRLQSWAPLSFNWGNEHNQRDLYNAAPATEAGRCRARMNTSVMSGVAMSGSPISNVFTLRAIVFYSWGNLLLAFVPIGIVTYLSRANSSIVFTSNAIAIIPLSGLLTYATESIASDMGDTVGALMNISFGNLIEVVIL